MPYRAYFKAASESLIIADLQGLIVEANPKTCSLFGYADSELVGKSVDILVPHYLRERHSKHRLSYMSAPRSRPMGIGMRLVGRRKGGSEFPVEISLTYAPDTPSGDLIVAAVVDISERLTLEHQARRAETMISLGTVAAGIAHDLNNPLSVILSRTELLLDAPAEALTLDTIREDLRVIQRQGRRASNLVSGFLEISRHGAKRVAVVNLNDVAQRALLLMGEQMRKSGIRVVLVLDRELPAVTGDGVALERVLINLLANARDAMSDGGAVRIETKRMDERPGWLRLSVGDNGPGIHPEALNRIFDLLYTTKPGGSGLGLWLSRRIMREHGGRIEVRSELGTGTTFMLVLPFSPQHNT